MSQDVGDKGKMTSRSEAMSHKEMKRDPDNRNNSSDSSNDHQQQQQKETFSCQCGNTSGICPGFLARTVLPNPCVQSNSGSHSVPCPAESLNCDCPLFSYPGSITTPDRCGQMKCSFGDPCSPCFAITHRHRRLPEVAPAGCCLPPCTKGPLIDCIPRLPPKPCGFSAWKPTPPAFRSNPETQLSRQPCKKGPCNPCPEPLACERDCSARDIVASRTYLPPKECIVCDGCEPVECNPAPAVPIYTCGLIGAAKNNARITPYYLYPGYLDVPGGSRVICRPQIPCCTLTDRHLSHATRQPVRWCKMDIHPQSRLEELCLP